MQFRVTIGTESVEISAIACQRRRITRKLKRLKYSFVDTSFVAAALKSFGQKSADEFCRENNIDNQQFDAALAELLRVSAKLADLLRKRAPYQA